MIQTLRGSGKQPQPSQCRARQRVSVAVLLSVALALAVLAAPAGAANGGAGEQSIRIWASFDGDTPVSGGRVHVYADGHELRGNGIAGSNRRTFSDGTALLLVDSLPSRIRVVISGGRAGGRPVRGSLKTNVSGASVGDVVEVNPVTTVADVWEHREGGSDHHARDLIERTLGIPLTLDDADLRATDRWFDGDRFQRWTLERGSVEQGARALVRLADEPGFDRRRFRSHDGEGREAPVAAAPVEVGTDAILKGVLDKIEESLSGSGPTGVFFGLALKGLRAAIADGTSVKEETQLDRVEAQLKVIGERIAGLQVQVTQAVYQQKIAQTHTYRKDIDNAQDDLDWALSGKQKGWKPGDNPPPALGTERRAAIFEAGTKQFDDKVHDNLVKGGVAAKLDDLLADQQPGGTAPLLKGVSADVGAQRFFTHQSSVEIDRFFDYYKEYELRLAILLSEYYTSRGDPTLSVKANLESAKRNVGDIKNVYLPKQGALKPAKKVDPGVFIDRNTRLMWRLELTRRKNPEILDGGLSCRVTEGDAACSLINTATVFPGLDYPTPWDVPAAPDFRTLVAGSGPSDEPLARLNSLGVRYDGKPLPSGSFWLKGDFYGGNYRFEPAEIDKVKALVFTLNPGAKSLKTDEATLGRNCYQNMAKKVFCQTWNRDAYAFIFWRRGPMSDAEGGDYWCEPGKPKSWEPAKC